MADKEYIEREAAIKKLDHFQSHLHTVEGTHAIGVAKTLIKEIPAADVRPVVRGEWEEENSASNRWSFRCSVCGEGGRGYKFNFCSNCGADMRETNDEKA